MIKDTQALKTEIASALDSLSLEELQNVYEFVAFLRWRNQQREASPDNTVKEDPPSAEEEIPDVSRTGWKEWDQRFDQ